jgi:hypothetical protein
MSRRISVWALIGFIVACCWVVAGFLVGHNYNLGRSTFAAVTAPVSLLGRRMPLSMLWFTVLNGGLYATIGLAIELLRRPYRLR